MRLLAVFACALALPALAQEKERADFEAALKTNAPSDGAAEGKLGAPSMRRANKAAAEILQRRMEESRPADLQLLRAAAGADVIVTSGEYDRVQDVLRAVGVKHVVIPPSLLDRIDLLPTQTLMVNCPGHVSEAAVKKVRDFVRRGGYLVTTDWAITLVQRAFPGTIRHNLRTTPNDVVRVQLRDAGDALVKGIKVLSEEPRWWLETSSYPVHIDDQKRVHVLLDSDEMKKRYGDGAVVVAFRYEDGKVLHMTSHFYLQQGKLLSQAEKTSGASFAQSAGVKGVGGLDKVTAGELNSAYSMQQMSANLLVEKQKENQALMAKKYSGQVVADGLAVKRDYRVEVLEEKDGQKHVRDLFGHESWLPAATVK